MSFRNTLARILDLLNGETPPKRQLDVTNTVPKEKDSKEILAMKWAKLLESKE